MLPALKPDCAKQGEDSMRTFVIRHKDIAAFLAVLVISAFVGAMDALGLWALAVVGFIALMVLAVKVGRG